MDPSTTLVTFLLQTAPSVQSVQLIGSWDNFSQSYSMERDVRRGRGQWRGCYSFRDIICDDVDSNSSSKNNNNNSSSPYKRNGGLKMGQTYYYYYEVDGSVETHDPAMPSTTACPYLPGQTVNTLSVPVEQALRHRSASLSSMRHDDLKTMDPNAKFVPPRPAPAPPLERPILRRLGSSPLLNHSRPSSPAPAWKRFFTRKLASRETEQSRSRDPDDQSVASCPVVDDEERSTTSSDGQRTRDISPESLRRFLSDEVPSRPNSNLSQRPAIVIPEEIVEETEDDDNFAISAVSELQPFSTSLSPPPCKRSASSDTIPQAANNSSALTLIPARPSHHAEAPTSAILPCLPKLETLSPNRAPLSPSCCSVFTSPISPQSPEEDMATFYDSTDDDDDVHSSNNSDSPSSRPLAAQHPPKQAFGGYSLPHHEDEGSKIFDSQSNYSTINSPQLFARADTALGVGHGNFLGEPIDTGLDDFVSELGWMVNVIGNKRD